MSSAMKVNSQYMHVVRFSITSKEDLSLNDVLESARSGIFGVAGQICTAMSRLVVHKSVKDQLLTKLVDLSKLFGILLLCD